MKKASEIFEGENSSLRKTFDEVVSRETQKDKEYHELPFARMNIMMKGNRLWLDITDIYQFSKKINEKL